ncbi:MAG: FtsK/SpoIIIE domain-containing protein [Actinomycetota bacterium]
MTVWRARVQTGAGGGTDDVLVEGGSSSTVGDLTARLGAVGFTGAALTIDGLACPPDRALEKVPLLHGSTINLGAPEASRIPAAGVHLVAVTGPDAGRHWFLPPSPTGGPVTVTIGRSTGADCTVDDPLASRRHARLTLSPAAITVEDLDSANGVVLEGRTTAGAVPLDLDDHFQIGSTVFTLTLLADDDRAVTGPAEGAEVPFPRQFRERLADLPAKLDPPRTTAPPSSSIGSTWWRALMPLVTGIGFAVITGRWEFLLISAVAPLVYGWDTRRRNKAQTREREEREATDEANRVAYEQRLAQFRAEAVTRSRRAALTGGLGALYTAFRHGRLWERTAADGDFGAVTLGLADLASPVARGGLEAHERDEPVWGSPLSVNLLDTGSLSIVGPSRRTRAVARSLLVNLAATHSPSEARLWLLTRNTNLRDWAFARWLPHTFDSDRSWSVASTPTDRTELAKRLTQLLTTRAEEADDRSRPLPLHVVVLDAAGLLPADDLARLLIQGPRLGIVGIVLDEHVVPEGTRAGLTLGDAADTASFRAANHPAVSAVATAELDPSAAVAAAVRLAPLRLSSAAAANAGRGVIHLVDLADAVDVDGPALVDRWARTSPDSAAVIGDASGTPMSVDIVRNGPHGLVGGTSGSGKTEFLKTLLMSLCLNNHPDDLSVVIVDFKGGVDHEPLKTLPHVIDVTTNLDIEDFERTIRLLHAEQERRQALFGQAGTSNLAAYRSARATRPELGPVPLLLVIVDEFSELLAHESGREKLKRLESISRVGRALGIHLLLVTQSFDGQLPPQIDENAGLRISLRVGKASNSKAVLGSPIAAEIPTHRVGRGYARYGADGELIEFQTARVAGRFQAAEAEVDELTTTVIPAGTMAVPAVGGPSGDVPFEQSDMKSLADAIDAAVGLVGWQGSAVPWPKTLPEQIPAAELIGLGAAEGATGDGGGSLPVSPPGAVAVGLADNPDRQRQELVHLSDRDQQLLLVGGPEADLPEAVSTLALVAAAHRAPTDLHLYGIDLLGRGLLRLAELPHCGGIASQNESLALRMLDELFAVVSRRKARLAEIGAADVWEAAEVGEPLPPQVTLLVSGADRLLLHGEGATSPLLGPINTFIQESLGTRVQVILAGLPSVAAHRIGANIGRRFVFTTEAGDLKGLGVRVATSTLDPPRRFVDTATDRVCQLVQLGPVGGSELDATRQVITALRERHPLDAVDAERGPRRITDVPWPLPMSVARRTPPEAPPGYDAPIPLGLETATGAWTFVDGFYDGPVIAVSGSSTSGRTTTLAAVAALAPVGGWIPIVYHHWPRSDLAELVGDDVAVFDDAVACAERIEQATESRLLLLVDDLDRARDQAPLAAALDHKDRCVVVAAGGSGVLDGMKGARDIRTCLVLAPRSARDGFPVIRQVPDQFLGRRQGRGVLSANDNLTGIQIPLV